MAKPVSDEELQLKKRARRRLVGAVVLVAAVAVILPMVLNSEPKPTSQEINIQIPSPDAKGFTSKVVPLAPPSKAKPADKAADKSADVPVAAAPEPARETPPAEKPVAKPVPEKAAKTQERAQERAPEKAAEKTADKTALPKPGTFFIQVTALADADNAKLVQRQIIDAGLLSYTQVVAAGQGNVTRVRAGPFATRDEAEKAREKLQRMGLEGKVAEIK